jgi:hypothetical protein
MVTGTAMLGPAMDDTPPVAISFLSLAFRGR